VIPANPKSGAQVGRRAMFKFLAQLWSDIGDADQATWQDLADQLVTSRFNAFLSENMQAWHDMLAPCGHTPPLRTGNIGTAAVPLAQIVEENRIKISVTLTTVNDNAAAIIFAKDATGFATAVSNAIIIGQATSAKTTYYYWTPPHAATWFFNLRFSTEEGLLGGEEGQQPPPP